MKQQITKEQLKELGSKEKKKLLEWQIEKNYAKNIFEYSSLDGSLSATRTGKHEIKTLSIGQMIEFLEEHSKKIHFVGQRWHNYVIKEVQECGDILIPYSVDELCDALWEAVKEVLKYK